jgi:signal transduction histidine kinase
MTNILRHAKATRVKVSLECKKDSLLLIISDNGIGIDKANISNSMSIGLIGMNERIRSVGGLFNIRGIREVGTSVKVYVPGKAINK